MNINSISNTVGNAIGGKYKKREMSNFKDNLDTIMKNAPKLDTYIPEEKLNGLDNSGVYNKTNDMMEAANRYLGIDREESEFDVSVSVNEEKLEEITQEYFKYPQIAGSYEDAKFRAALEASGNATRCENGILTIIDGYMIFTSFDEKKASSWNKSLDNREVYEDTCKNILKSGKSKDLEQEQFWQGVFQILDKGSEQQAAKTESTTDSKVVVKADGSRVLMITINVNGMKMTMSLEISKPTQMPNSEGDQESDTTTLNTGNLQSVDSEL